MFYTNEIKEFMIKSVGSFDLGVSVTRVSLAILVAGASSMASLAGECVVSQVCESKEGESARESRGKNTRGKDTGGKNARGKDTGGKNARGKDPRGRGARRGSGMGLDFEALDKDGDGFLTFDEFSQSDRLSRIDEIKRRKLFDYLDRDKNGKLHMRDLRSKPPRWMSALRKDFAKFDTDQTGGLDMVEFLKIAAIAEMDVTERNRLFKRLDRNRDNVIQLTELKGPGAQGAHKGRPGMDFKKHDLNRSGGLDYQEYSQMHWVSRIPDERRKELFEKLDLNKDGEVTPQEARQALSDRRKRHPGVHPHPKHKHKQLDRKSGPRSESTRPSFKGVSKPEPDSAIEL